MDRPERPQRHKGTKAQRHKGTKALNAYAAEVAHLIAGCAVGAARAGGSDGCAPGAIGAVIGHLTAQAVNPTGDPTLAAETLAASQLMAGVAGALASKDGQGVYIAAAAGWNAAENNWLSVPQLQNKDLSKKEQQEASLENNRRVEDACVGLNYQACGMALSQAAGDIAKLRAYREDLDQQLKQTTDPTKRAELSASLQAVGSQIGSANNAIRVGLMALNGGNFDVSTMTDQELIAMGFAFDAIGAAEVRGIGKVIKNIETLKDNAIWEKEKSRTKIENNQNADLPNVYDLQVGGSHRRGTGE